MKKLLFSAVAILAALGAGAAWADDYPARPVSLMVPYPAGAASDITARALQGPMARRWAARSLSKTWAGPTARWAPTACWARGPTAITCSRGRPTN